jgi:hypothetical protein
MVEHRLWLLFVFENAETAVQTLLLERVELAREVVEWIAAH